MTNLVLASNSPRRQELLKKAGFNFKVFVRDFDESFPDDLPAKQVAEYLAIEKNHNYRKILKEDTIITADTTVILGNEVLNKPKDSKHAAEMLQKLSGETHKVVCGVCISSPDKQHSFSDTTEVTFTKISEQESKFYISSFEPFDKAGAYGIQEWIGLTRISSIKGSYYNVMGLPTHLLYEVLLNEFNIHPY